jgi:putative oxidoreductase
MKNFLSPAPVWQKEGLFLIRVTVAFFLIYHGIEFFDSKAMKGYTEWDTFKSSTWLPYLGKAAELLSGVLLLFGLLTRLSCLISIATFAYITFFIGKGKFWYDDQHPFLFVLLSLVFIFTGPGALALDSLLFKKK